VIHSFDWLDPLHVLQKGIFRLIPYVSLFHGQLSFFNIAVQNARCRRLPNRLHDVVCFANRDPCCGKIMQFILNVILVAINNRIYDLFHHNFVQAWIVQMEYAKIKCHTLKTLKTI